MNKRNITPAIFAVAVLVSACSSMPKTTTLLDQTRGDYVVAEGNPSVARYAPLELKQAGEALAKANASARDDDSSADIDKLAYIAKQRIALTQEVAKQKSAEADVANSGKERDQLRLNQRTNEANQAKANAEQSWQMAQVAQNDAAIAQRDAAAAQRKTQEAQLNTQDAQARAAKLEAQLAELAAKKTERGLVITLGDVLFGTDLSRLNAEGMRTAQKLADVLTQNPMRTVLVEGFADSTGASAYNQELSERRATAVQSALLEMGIARDRVAVRGYGEAFPIAANTSEQTRQLNRRVEIVVSDDSGMISKR
ncbi:OmpA family protein [Uliginosibacterium flavum]|uniref:OmpA family protein n=1 Tax=Uliginosibacterium flavum TaxID=1396831 RepID=A0ABV2TLN5_9RHOO